MRNTLLLFSFLSVLLLSSGCSLKEYTLFQDENMTGEPTKISDEKYRGDMVFENKITPNDRVAVMVYNQSGAGNQQLTSMVDLRSEGSMQQERSGMLVTKNGTIRLPLLNLVKISGLTEDEAANNLIEKYKKYLRNPYVTVEILDQRIYVIGEVNQPGVVPVQNGTISLIEAIARTSDLTDYADRTGIKVLRGDMRDPEVRVIDLTQMASIQASSLYLRPNDIVYVVPRSSKGSNIAFNETAPPFKLIADILAPFVSITYLYKAIE